MDMEELFMLLFSLLIVMIIMWVTAAVLKKKKDAEDNAQPVLTKQAKLVDMQQIPAGQIVIGEIWVLFELETGERVRLNALVQNTLVIGDQGLLTWQGRKILKFERNSNM